MWLQLEVVIWLDPHPQTPPQLQLWSFIGEGEKYYLKINACYFETIGGIGLFMNNFDQNKEIKKYRLS